jgi:hypothetical protein
VSGELIICAQITVPTPTNKPFWLMLMGKSVHIVFESCEDGDKNELTVGDVMVRGY